MDRATEPLITWRDGTVPVAEAFQDPYYSQHDGAAEARHVFLAGNDLPGRFRPGFRIAELGFGTGLNLAVTAKAWAQARLPGGMTYTSFEAFPMAPADLTQALSAWPELAEVTAQIAQHSAAGRSRFRLGGLQVQLILGDARQTLPTWQGHADAWFLDGFSPARNPELWGPDLMAQVALHTSPGGTFATYTAAGHVRRALSDAGFHVTRPPGYAYKRHMSAGRL